MFKHIRIGLVALVTLMFFPSAFAADCLEFAGNYEAVPESDSLHCHQPIKWPGTSGFEFTNNTANLSTIETGINLDGQVEVTLQEWIWKMPLDGRQRFISKADDADNYYQSIAAVCLPNGQILIREHGTNNDTNMKRVDEYDSTTFLELSEGYLIVTIKSEQYAYSQLAGVNYPMPERCKFKKVYKKIN